MTLSPRMRIIVAGVVSFLAGGVLVYAFEVHIKQNSFPIAKRVDVNKYKYIDPLLLCNNDTNGTSGEILSLKNNLEHIIKNSQNKGDINNGSVYFRSILDGKWVGVNEEDMYSPASLLKVPILMAYFKASEKDNGLLYRKALYQQDPGSAPPLVDNPILISGNSYAVKDLIRGMIIDSDNTATKMLVGGLGEDPLSQAYSELGLPDPYHTSSPYMMSTRTYALFFRILYNATFLSRETSEKALAMLSEVKFDKGIVAGTPSGTNIAHKYGYAILKNDAPRVIELSDCGIVYQPDKPYLLCVMAQGTDPDVTATFIKDVASAISQYVENK